jgi:hypothetical protein
MFSDSGARPPAGFWHQRAAASDEPARGDQEPCATALLL